MPNASERPRRVIVDRDGPVLIEGPVEVVTEDGTTVVSHRFVVAVCTCQRSKNPPWCDTSHRNAGRGHHRARRTPPLTPSQDAHDVDHDVEPPAQPGTGP